MFRRIKIFTISFLLFFALIVPTLSQDYSDFSDKADPDEMEYEDFSEKDDPDDDSGSFDDMKLDPDDFEDEVDSIEEPDYKDLPNYEVPASKDNFEDSSDEEIEDSEEYAETAEYDKEDPDEMEDEELSDESETDEDENEDSLQEDDDEADKADPDELEDEESENIEETKPKKEVVFEPSENTLSFSLEILSIPSDYYNFYTLLDVRYRNYFHNPFYWFCGGAFGSSSPNGDFPYTYQSNGKNIGAPHSYLNYTYGGFGYVYNNKEHEFTVFSELSLGTAFRFLYNNSLKNAHFGKLYPNVISGLAVGGTWKYARAEVGVNFDSNFKFEISGSIGVSIPIDVLKSLFTGKKRTESKPVL